ncbi:MAG: lysylphosphatidylglycerol synthase transmembrane domain-containing protein [Bryobacteraceae bacterium]|jgi:uncharacterized protein (TIRG00374 family)
MDPSPKRQESPRWLPQALGYCLSAACLVWVLHGYPIKEELVPAIRELDWKWIAVAILSDLSVYVVHGWRWNILLAPVVKLRLWRSVQAIYIGLFANEILPLRAGELIRCYLLAHWNDVRFSLVLASGVVERLIDGFWMLAVFLLTIRFVRGVPKDLTLLVQGLGLGLLLGGIALYRIASRRRHAHALGAERGWSSAWRHVTEGLQLMGGSRTMAQTVGISLLYLAIQVFSVWALMKADRLDLSLWSAGAVLAIVRWWTVVPSAPGNIGLVNVACVTALKLLEVEPNDAKTFSIIYFVALTAPLMIGGGIATALAGVSITELRGRAKRGLRAAHIHATPHR